MSALDTQIGGSHYKNMPIQPMQYSMANELDACQHTIIKYVTRFREKGGVQDLEKAKHVIDMLIEFEQNGVKPAPAQKSFDFNAMLNEALKDSAESANTKKSVPAQDKPPEVTAPHKYTWPELVEKLGLKEADECACAACVLERNIRTTLLSAGVEVIFIDEDTGRVD